MSPEPTVTDAERGHGKGASGDQPEPAGLEAETPAPPPVVRDPAPPPALREPAAAEPVVERRRPAKPPKPPKPLPTPTAPPPAPTVGVTPLEDLSRHERKKAARRRARRVKRIVRRVDAWSVLKVSFLFFLCVYVVSIVALVVLWNVAAGAGVVENIESFIEDLGAFETFEFEADKLFQGAALGGAILAVLASGLAGLGAVLFNLISDLVGGIRMTVIEEPTIVPTARPKAGGEPTAATPSH